jgi:hypothetical protein
LWSDEVIINRGGGSLMSVGDVTSDSDIEELGW